MAIRRIKVEEIRLSNVCGAWRRFEFVTLEHGPVAWVRRHERCEVARLVTARRTPRATHCSRYPADDGPFGGYGPLRRLEAAASEETDKRRARSMRRRAAKWRACLDAAYADS